MLNIISKILYPYTYILSYITQILFYNKRKSVSFVEIYPYKVGCDYMEINKRKINFFSCILLSFFLLGCNSNTASVQNEKSKKIVTVANASEAKKDDNRVENVTLSSVGDILIHNTVYMAAYDAKNNTYDFKPQFAGVKKYLEKSDITIANLETTLAGKERGYSGYPAFNSPDEIVDALKDSGVDVLTAANNHRVDTGEKGFFRTVKTVKDKGLDIIGVKSSTEEKSYVIKDIKGIKIGIANFTYETSPSNGFKTLNGIAVPKTVEPLIDMVDLSKLDETYKTLENRVAEMKANGAEVLVFCMHWGNEYQRMPSKEQELTAKKLSDLGVDIILGGHTHVLEPMDFIHSDISKKDTFIIYSQGNFISDQRLETINNRNSEDGIIVNVGIKKTFKNNKIEITFADYMPTWVNKKTVNNNLFYEVIPTEDALTGVNFPNINEDDKKRIAISGKETTSLMEKFTSKATVAPLSK